MRRKKLSNQDYPSKQSSATVEVFAALTVDNFFSSFLAKTPIISKKGVNTHTHTHTHTRATVYYNAGARAIYTFSFKNHHTLPSDIQESLGQFCSISALFPVLKISLTQHSLHYLNIYTNYLNRLMTNETYSRWQSII
jgi:hypothetical protein